MQKTIVVGIGGGSGSGKTSLTDGLVKSFPNNTIVLHLDDYFIPESKMTRLAGEINWDDPASIDDNGLVNDILQLLKRPDIPSLIIVEGFLILYFPEICKLLDLKIFLGGSYETINQRRVHPMWENYRKNVLKPMYVRYVEPSSENADTIFDVTKLSEEKILERTVKLIHARFDQSLTGHIPA